MTNDSLMKIESIPLEHSAILLTCIKRYLVLKINFVFLKVANLDRLNCTLLSVSGAVLEGALFSRQTLLAFVFSLCICVNLYIYIYFDETHNQVLRRKILSRKDMITYTYETSTKHVSSEKSPPIDQGKTDNGSNQLYTNLKLSLEMSLELHKALSEAIRSISKLEKLVSNRTEEKSHVTSTSGSVKTGKSGKALLTMFTTWDENNKARDLVYNNTIRNWASFKPMINPVLFTNNEAVKEKVKYHGWHSLPLSRTSEDGIPILKYMYLTAMDNFESDFYGFVNSDILFHGNLLKTLVTAKFSLDLSQPMLITGSRYNVDNVTDVEAEDRGNLLRLAKERGELFLPWAADYFITTRAFPWTDIPEIIISGLGFDNFMILFARERKFLVIDGTKTIPAIHQTTKAGNFEGFSKSYARYNLDLLNQLFNRTLALEKGQVVCTEIVSSFAKENIIFEKRAQFQPYCPM